MNIQYLSRRSFLKRVSFSTMASAFAFNRYPVYSQVVKRPNFIFILTDDQGWNGLSVRMDPDIPGSESDYYETPTIQRLAEQGMRFSNGYSPAPLCTPTRRSIQFGKTPARLRGTEFNSEFNPIGELSIAKMLKSVDSDYVCAHFGKWGELMNAMPMQVGYDDDDGQTGNRTGGQRIKKKSRNPVYEVCDNPKLTFGIAERANRFLDRHIRAGRSFYMQLSYYATHYDFEVREKTIKKYLKMRPGRVHTFPEFGAMTEDLDAGIGLVMDKLKELGIEETTYIFYMADNGGSGFVGCNYKDLAIHPDDTKQIYRNHPLRSGKQFLYEGGIRVPFFVKGPGIKAGTVCHVPVAGWDLLPTISALADNTNPLPDDLDGVNLSGLLRNEGKGNIERDFLVFHRPLLRNYAHSAIRCGDYKMIKFYENEELCLYNLKDDISEKVNLAGEKPDIADELHKKMMNYLASVNAEVYRKKEIE